MNGKLITTPKAIVSMAEHHIPNVPRRMTGIVLASNGCVFLRELFHAVLGHQSMAALVVRHYLLTLLQFYIHTYIYTSQHCKCAPLRRNAKTKTISRAVLSSRHLVRVCTFQICPSANGKAHCCAGSQHYRHSTDESIPFNHLWQGDSGASGRNDCRAILEFGSN